MSAANSSACALAGAAGEPTSDRPHIIVEEAKGALRIAAVDAIAARRGLCVGEPLADARARVPDLIAHDADPQADAALVEHIADWCDRYTPLVALDPPDGLLLDISGCAHLFADRKNGDDGERALLDDLAPRLRAQGFAVRAGLADTPGAAWAVARFGGRPGLQGAIRIPPRETREALLPLPLCALRLEPDTVAALDRVGLKRIGDIADRPRAPLASRFGPGLITRLDQAMGFAEEPISPRMAVAQLSVERRLAEPIAREEDVREALRHLASLLARRLEKAGLGARALEFTLFRVDGAVRRLVVGTGAPLRSPARVLSLFAEKLRKAGDELDAGFGFDLLRLSVLESQRDDGTQIGMGEEAAQADALAHLIDRLGARLGLRAVTRFLPCDTHLPEHRSASVPAALAREDALFWIAEATGGAGPTRPLRLLERAEPVETVAGVPDGPPLRFRWRRAFYEIARSEGPERLAAQWWSRGADAPTRDYFRVEDTTGRRFWLYREGLYGRETAAPRWYLHGLFA
ncbi:DNA polymerase Y family protein [Breoghania sp.]|uniref:DinB/UmuC family translesion DNA polymerase n=1 Tax=Breoghania sp. TaxID=2065378 RepID=UPI002AAC2EAF|nr:DNA polymerase Y family protein [Breoghania sp.]